MVNHLDLNQGDVSVSGARPCSCGNRTGGHVELTGLGRREAERGAGRILDTRGRRLSPGNQPNPLTGV